jgi:DNA-binding GntR family transcriptional regulator
MPLQENKLQTETLRQQIAAGIWRAILKQSLRPGERVVERDIAAKLGASLTATREAIIQLETEGLIIKRPNATTHIAQLSQTDIEQIYEVRAVLEEYAFEQAALNATAEDIRAIKSMYAEFLSLARQGKALEYVEADLLWHQAVWQASHNIHLAQSLRRLVAPLFGFSQLSLATQEGFDLVQDARLHAPLLKAIVARDTKRIRELYRETAAIWKKGTLEASPRKQGGAVKRKK